MENIYYLGDLIFTKNPISMTTMIYLFNGAKQTDNGWLVTLTTLAAQGYAGGGSTLELEVKEEDSIRLGAGCKASVRNPMKPNKAYINKRASKMYFDKIEKDMIELSFDFI